MGMGEFTMIYVVRHGQTDLNRERKIQGRMGLPLNEYGIEQAKVLRDALKNINFDYVFSSPQERAIQTAEIITSHKAIIDERLDVYDVGEADRISINELKMNGFLLIKMYIKGWKSQIILLKESLVL